MNDDWRATIRLALEVARREADIDLDALADSVPMPAAPSAAETGPVADGPTGPNPTPLFSLFVFVLTPMNAALTFFAPNIGWPVALALSSVCLINLTFWTGAEVDRRRAARRPRCAARGCALPAAFRMTVRKYPGNGYRTVRACDLHARTLSRLGGSLVIEPIEKRS